MLAEVRAVSLAYPRLVVDLPDMLLTKGEHTLLLGASGTGKTSMLLCLAGLLPPATGTVTVQGQSLYGLCASKRDAFRAAHIGIVFQMLHLLPDLTAAENILLGLRIGKRGEALVRLDALTRSLGIVDVLSRLPRQISHGQAQRVAIARALMARPALLLADEPTAALDDVNATAVADLLLKTAAEHGTTLLIATHDTRLKALGLRALTLPTPPSRLQGA